MGSLYRRRDSEFWWVAFKDASGRRKLKSTGTKDEAAAKKVLAGLERKVRAEKESGLAEAGPVTVRGYFEKWIKHRRERGISSVDDDETRIRKHALPALSDFRLEEVRPHHLRSLVTSIEGKGELAPRSVLHIYGVLRVMFSDAVTEELISSSPCVLQQRRGELPKKRDKDLSWRPTAIFEREEVEALISDVRIPLRRRVLYGLEFLGGFRANEITPRRWKHYNHGLQPLGKLTAATAYDLKRKTEKSTTKTGVAREVPVHPTLAALLAEWKLSGWSEHYGRMPTEEDLILPAVAGGFMSSTSALKRLHEDCTLLGLRVRRQHDARRTFISLGLADGARKEILRWVTHPPADQMDLYTTLPWASKCAEVAKLNIQLRKGEVRGPALPELSTAVLRPGETRVRSDNSKMEAAGIEGAAFVPEQHNQRHNRSKSAASAVDGSRSRPAAPVDRSNVAPHCYVARARAHGMRVLVAGREL